MRSVVLLPVIVEAFSVYFDVFIGTVECAGTQFSGNNKLAMAKAQMQKLIQAKAVTNQRTEFR